MESSKPKLFTCIPRNKRFCKHRGYNSFVQHFFEIVEILELNFGKAKKVEKEDFLNWIKTLDKVVFSDYLPFPNRVVFAIDSNELGDFIDKSLLDPINSMRRLTGIDLYTKPSTIKQNKVAKSLLELAGFYFNYMHYSFFIKPALIRKHVSSSRSHFTLRTVITRIRDNPSVKFQHAIPLIRKRNHILSNIGSGDP